MAQAADPGPIVCFGDSLTEGWGVAPEESYPAVLERLLGLPVVNAGWRGDRAEDALDRFASQVLGARPRLVVLCFGGNEADQGDPVEAALAGQERIVRLLRHHGIPCLLLGTRIARYGDAWDEALKGLARRHGCGIALDVLGGILADPRTRSDPDHPNAEGYALLAQRIRPAVETALGRTDA